MTTADTLPDEGSGETIESLRARAADLELQVQTLTSQARANLLMADLKAEALRAGMVDLDGLKLLDTTSLAISDAGDVVGCAALINRFRREKPWLFAGVSSAAGAAPPPSHPPRMKQAMEMTPEEYRAARAAIIRRF